MKVKSLDTKDKNIEAFFALIRAGFWEKEVKLLPYGDVDFAEVLELAEEQSVVGLVAAGIEHITDGKPQKKDVLQFIGRTVQLEQRNHAMNYFIGVIVEKMREAGIETVLVKGQGVAQCYERPLWRSCGDVDFFLDSANYQKAKAYLTPLAEHVDAEDVSRLHLGMTIDPWIVELHGTMDTEISKRINRKIAEIQKDIFENNGVRIWLNDAVDVPLPSPDNDVFIIFTHFIDHFYVGGVGLRQICDWCRLLWTYKDEIDRNLLEGRLMEMELTEEWKAFASFAVEYLAMPVEAMPLYEKTDKYRRKARRICNLVIETGNFGHNKDESYRARVGRVKSFFITFWRRLKEFVRLTTIFPSHAPRFFVNYVFTRIKVVL